MMNVAPCASACRVIARYQFTDRDAVARIPFLVLRDVSLQRGDTHRRAATQERRRSNSDFAPDRNRHYEHNCGGRSTPRGGIALDEQIRRGCGNKHEKSGDPVDADDRCNLRDWQNRHLTVAKERPWKAVPDILPAEFSNDPD
jgi:hypothetical protein